jgi:hypothetical protein
MSYGLNQAWAIFKVPSQEVYKPEPSKADCSRVLEITTCGSRQLFLSGLNKVKELDNEDESPLTSPPPMFPVP